MPIKQRSHDDGEAMETELSLALTACLENMKEIKVHVQKFSSLFYS